MKKLIIIAVLLFAILTLSNAQDYNTGIGIRGGLYNGLTIKHFLSQKSAAEFLLDTKDRGFAITGLYEIHANAFDTPRLNWYYGIGGHVGFWNGDNVSWASDSDSYTVIGVDGILGIEYNFEEIPINISLDWKPAFNLIGYSGFWADGGGFSIRYIF